MSFFGSIADSVAGVFSGSDSEEATGAKPAAPSVWDKAGKAVKEYASWRKDPAAQAAHLKETSFNDWGAVNAEFSGRTAGEMLSIKQAYECEKGPGSFEQRFGSDLGRWDTSKVDSKKVDGAMQMIYGATGWADNDEGKILEAVRGKSPAELDAMREQYLRDTGESLDKWLRESSGLEDEELVELDAHLSGNKAVGAVAALANCADDPEKAEQVLEELTPDERTHVKEEWAKSHPDQPLSTFLAEEVNDEWFGYDEEGAQKLDYVLEGQDGKAAAMDAAEALSGWFDDDEDAFVASMASLKTDEERRQFEETFAALYGQELSAAQAEDLDEPDRLLAETHMTRDAELMKTIRDQDLPCAETKEEREALRQQALKEKRAAYVNAAKLYKAVEEGDEKGAFALLETKGDKDHGQRIEMMEAWLEDKKGDQSFQERLTTSFDSWYDGSPVAEELATALYDKGKADGLKLYYATESLWGTDEAFIKDTTKDLSREEMDAAMVELQQQLEAHGEVGPEGGTINARDWIDSELSGRSQHDFDLGLKYGNDVSRMSADQMLGRENDSYEYETGWGGKFAGLFSATDDRLERRHELMGELGKNGVTEVELTKLRDVMGDQQADFDLFRTEKDSVADVAGTAAGLAALAACAFIPGAQALLPFIASQLGALGVGTTAGMAAAGALVSGAGTMLAKTAILGGEYAESAGMDAATTLIAAASAGIVNGEGAGKLFGSLAGRITGNEATQKYLASMIKGAAGGFLDATADTALGAAQGEDVSGWNILAGTIFGGVGGVAGHSGGGVGAALAESSTLEKLIQSEQARKLFGGAAGGLFGGVLSGAVTSGGDWKAMLLSGLEGGVGGLNDAKVGMLAEAMAANEGQGPRHVNPDEVVQAEAPTHLDVAAATQLLSAETMAPSGGPDVLDEIIARGGAASDANLPKLENQPILLPTGSAADLQGDPSQAFEYRGDGTIPELPAGPTPFEQALGALGYGQKVTRSGTDALGTDSTYESEAWVDLYFKAVESMEAMASSTGTDDRTQRGKAAYELLSPEEWMALNIYTSEKYKSINPALRGMNPAAGEAGHDVPDYLAQIQPMIDVAVDGMEKLPTYDDPSVRGTSISDAKLAEYAAAAGTGVPVAPDKAFMSTTTDQNVADTFSTMTAKPGSQQVIMEFEAGHQGKQLDFLSDYAHEAEVLMPPSMEVVVKEIEDRGGYKVIKLGNATDPAR